MINLVAMDNIRPSALKDLVKKVEVRNTSAHPAIHGISPMSCQSISYKEEIDAAEFVEAFSACIVLYKEACNARALDDKEARSCAYKLASTVCRAFQFIAESKLSSEQEARPATLLATNLVDMSAR